MVAPKINLIRPEPKPTWKMLITELADWVDSLFNRYPQTDPYRDPNYSLIHEVSRNCKRAMQYEEMSKTTPWTEGPIQARLRQLRTDAMQGPKPIDSSNMGESRLKSIDYTWVAGAGWKLEYDPDEDEYEWLHTTPLAKAEQLNHTLAGKYDRIHRRATEVLALLTEICLDSEFHNKSDINLSAVEEVRKLVKEVLR